MPTGFSQPLILQDDLVYPLHLLDHSMHFRQMIVTRMLRFDEVLDVNMLRNSLSLLLEIGDWKKLGGRLRLKDNANLEVHVPRTFTAQRMAVTFSENITGVSINNHPVAKLLPCATDYPSIQRSPQDFQVLATPPDAPRRLRDFLYRDIPVLSVHFTTFSDATLVGLTLPHVIMDAFGLQGLLTAWSLVLSGNEKEVPPSLGVREDVLRDATNIDDSPRETYKLLSMKLTGFALLIFGLRLILNLLWNWSTETHTIFLPSATINQLRRQARNDLQDEISVDKEVFLSDGDILAAWIARIVAIGQPSSRPITIMQSMNARLRLSAVTQRSGVFLQNMVLASFVFLSSKASTEPLGRIAYQNRLQLAEQTTKGQVAAHLRELQEPAYRNDPMMLCGPSNGLPLIITNWTKAKLPESANFTPAVIPTESGNNLAGRPRGRATYYHGTTMEVSRMTQNLLVILGKDPQGNYWLNGTFHKSFWERMRRALEQLQAESLK